jgi:hypothetical protein
MNSSLVKSVPQGDFAEISALVKNWEMKLRTLASEKKPIKFDVYPMSKVPSEIDILLNQQGYRDIILENDRWQHFLVPSANNTLWNRALNSGV